MTPDEIARLAAMGNALRPAWPVASLRTFIERNLHARAYGDAAVALAWVATRTKTETPRLLLESGDWWRAATLDHPGSVVRFPPKRHQECHQHPGEWADACRPCATDRRAVDARETVEPITGPGPKAVRAALRKKPA